MEVKIICNQEGYRRAGLGFRKGENVYSENQLTDEQLEQLMEDPNLSVRFGGILTDESATLAETLAQVTDERDQLKAENRTLKEDNDALFEARSEHTALNEELSQAKSKIGLLEADLKKAAVISDQVDELKAKLAAAEAEIEKLKKPDTATGKKGGK
jgi:DNA repair exonuclease SbcCD ATPase subunit